MYIQRIDTKQNGKVYKSIVLCHSYRQNGKQKRKILATLTKWPSHIIDGLEKLLKGNAVFSLDDLDHGQGKSFGAIWVFFQLAHEIGLVKALGSSLEGKLALLQILARCISQSSRLHIANHWPEHYAIEEVLKIGRSFDEDDLYENLDWLSLNQTKIEKKLFSHKHGQGSSSDTIYLYDVTSSYLEGQDNELADWGYNRDKKKGKKQIVIGLLCDDEGDPISVEVFKGNTSDLSTFSSQLTKLKEQFGVKRVVVVGDKGMIKTKQIDEVTQMEWNYITSITKAQIQSLLQEQVFQMELFDVEPVEVQDADVRYILRRNPKRAVQVQANRNDKIISIEALIQDQNAYLSDHPRAKTETATKKIEALIKKLKLQKIVRLAIKNNRNIEIIKDDQALQQAELLDGCYVIKTELDPTIADANQVHDRYKDLIKVEHAFRTMKTGLEEIRPIFVRKESRTRGHVFVCMLAYKLIHKFRSFIEDMNQMPTMKEMIKSLDAIHYSTYIFKGKSIKILPTKLNNTQQQILNSLNLKMPTKLYAK